MGRMGLRDFSMLLAWVMIVVYFASAEATFLSSRNLAQLAIELSVTAVLALGMLLIILPGHIDLSVGSGLGLMGGLAAVLVFHLAWPAPLALVVATGVSVLVYAGMGMIIARERIPAFIITLGGLLVFKGLHWLAIENSTVPVSAGGATNLYSLLTTYYLPPLAGLALAGGMLALLVVVRIRSHRRRRKRPPDFLLGDGRIDRDAVDAVGLFVKAVVAQFIAHEEGNDQAAGQPHRQPRHIDEGIALVLAQIPQGDFQVVFQHGFWCLRPFCFWGSWRGSLVIGHWSLEGSFTNDQ